MSDREKVIEGLKAMHDFLGVGLSSQTQVFEEDQKILEDAIVMLKEQDTKTGYWITEEPNTYTRRTYCSVCSKSAPFIYVSDDYYGGRSHGETKNTKYCPNCGAKMET